MRYHSFIDASCGYHNLRLDEKSSYLMTFACQCVRYMYKHLPFGAAPAGDMFQHKIDEIFNDMPNVFGIADDILVVGYEDNGMDHKETVKKVPQRCREDSLKLNKDKCHFRCTSIPYFGEVILRNGVQPDPQKIKALMEMPPSNNKKKLQAFLGIINYLSKFSPSTATICEPLQKLTSSRAVWMWNTSYQGIYDKTKSLIKADACMKL